MSKVKLNKEELAALDALIASLESESTLQSDPGTEFSFIVAIARVAVAAARVAARATPVVAELVGAAVAGNSDLSDYTNSEGKLDLDSLIKLRNDAQ